MIHNELMIYEQPDKIYTRQKSALTKREKIMQLYLLHLLYSKWDLQFGEQAI
ncbi:MAG: hypothetical protein LBD75_06980 [Candidatus Peribacteria bacterium]|jgi:hypothetical protein|nr:hypothetical protein [Candidatus Peribacteria bacterium]